MKRGLTVVLVLALVLLLAVPVAASTGDPIKGLGDLIKDWVIKAGEFVLDGLKTLFIPREDFFSRLADRLHSAFQEKFGSLLSLAQYLKERFSDLRAYNGDLLVIKFPQDHFFGGVNLDLLNGAEGMVDMVRGAFSGFVVICTAIFAYKKVVAMINT